MIQNLSKNKRGKPRGVRISFRDGLWVKYRLRCAGFTITAFAEKQGVSAPTIGMVLSGRRSSKRLLTAVYQTLGYASFEAMIAAARGKGGAA